MSTIRQEIRAGNPNPAPYIDLWVLNTIPAGGTTIHYLTAHEGPNGNPISFGGLVYTTIPLQASGFVWDGTTASPPQPTITISNVDTSVLMYEVEALGDIVGAQVIRYRTFATFLDSGASPDVNQCRVDKFLIYTLQSMTKAAIKFTLCSPFDRPTAKIPGRLILKDQGFPSVNRV
jgi:lambda family phage minor tail protein L